MRWICILRHRSRNDQGCTKIPLAWIDVRHGEKLLFDIGYPEGEGWP